MKQWRNEIMILWKWSVSNNDDNENNDNEIIDVKWWRWIMIMKIMK